MESASADQIGRNWKSASFVQARLRARQLSFSSVPVVDPEKQVRRHGSPRVSDVDAADYAVAPGDFSDISDSLGDWSAHRDEERLASIGGKLRLEKGARRGRSEFSFPDQSSDGAAFGGWLLIAERGGASAGQLQKARRMVTLGLDAKARRQAYCGVIGARFDCVSFGPGRSGGHRFYRRFRCRNRYCLKCGPQRFRDLFARYVKLRDVVAKLVPQWSDRGRRGRPDRVVAKIDFTTKNLGKMPTPSEVREFNLAIRRFFRLVERRFNIGREEYGVIWTDEFGYRNSNLHAHAMWAGPWLPNRRRELSTLWRLACRNTVFGGSFIVSVKSAESFEAGLAHSLKYAGKTLDLDPDRLADLELAFHRVRRVHTLAAFYNVPVGPSPADLESGCPVCGAVLVRVGTLALISVLEAQGCCDLDVVRLDTGRRIALGARASPVLLPCCWRSIKEISVQMIGNKEQIV
jgi:hypothetical protein